LAPAELLPRMEAVAQRSGRAASAAAGGCGVADGSVVSGGLTTRRAPFQASWVGDCVSVELGEVVGCHQ